MLLAIFGAFLGSLGGLGIAIWIEWLKRPNLLISIGVSSDQEPGNIPARFLNLSVTNALPPAPLRWFITRQSALSCYARIDFLRLDGSAVFARPMDARWTGSPQLPQLAQGGIIHASDVDILRYRDIHTNRAEGMDVAVKFGAENHCYGFTNTSYLHDLRDPDWLLPADRYRITVSIYTGSFTATKSFILRNDWPRPDFCLQDEA